MATTSKISKENTHSGNITNDTRVQAVEGLVNFLDAMRRGGGGPTRHIE